MRKEETIANSSYAELKTLKEKYLNTKRVMEPGFISSTCQNGSPFGYQPLYDFDV